MRYWENVGFVRARVQLFTRARAKDGFTTDLTMNSAFTEDTILAYEKDGEPLHRKIRLVAPGRWGYKWIYLLNRVELVDYNFLGSYESRGFPDGAEIP